MPRKSSRAISTSILTELCSIPTAPFAERRVYDYVRSFVAQRSKRLSLSRDRFGNHLVLSPGDPKRPRLIFVAHTDHPGFIARRMLDERTLLADFRGGVTSAFAEGAKIRFFADGDDRGVVGTVLKTSPSKERKTSLGGATIRVPSRIAPGTLGMFDHGVGRIRGKKFLSRVCDDLAGAAAAMTMLDALSKRPKQRGRATVGLLLTRAEEEGFIGAIAALREPKLIRKSDRVISIECSAEQPFARQGDGVIVRVGDRISVFDSDFTYWMTQQAEQLAKRDKSFKHQRALMPGGACEATVFSSYNYITGAACVALGSYHNMDRAKKCMGPEFVDLTDWTSMVKLFIQLAANAHAYERGMTALKSRLEKRFFAWERFF